jgi:hypothetical protein
MSRFVAANRVNLPVLIVCLSALLIAADYPAVYLEAGLPTYPDAKVIDVGRQTRSLRDGIRLQLETKDNPKQVAEYFERTLKASGWKIPKRPVKTMQLALLGATKGKMYLTVQAMKVPSQNKTRIMVNVIQKL